MPKTETHPEPDQFGPSDASEQYPFRYTFLSHSMISALYILYNPIWFNHHKTSKRKSKSSPKRIWRF